MKRLLAALAVAATLIVGCVPPPSSPPPSRCDLARAKVEASGDVLPQSFRWYCYGDALGHAGYTNWQWDGYRVWGNVVIDSSLHDKSAAAFLYVVAHELCHARAASGLEGFNASDEIATDHCAVRYGFPPPRCWGYINRC